jgi:hypothetical protein
MALSPTVAEMREAAGVYFETEWTALSTGVPIFWSNVEGDPGADAPRDVGYIEFMFAPGDAYQTSTGGGTSGTRWRQLGQIFCNIYSPLGLGEATALDRASKIQGIFLGQRIAVSGSPTGLRFGRRDAPVMPTVHGAGDRWWQASVSAGFFCDFFKT